MILPVRVSSLGLTGATGLISRGEIPLSSCQVLRRPEKPCCPGKERQIMSDDSLPAEVLEPLRSMKKLRWISPPEQRERWGCERRVRGGEGGTGALRALILNTWLLSWPASHCSLKGFHFPCSLVHVIPYPPLQVKSATPHSHSVTSPSK